MDNIRYNTTNPGGIDSGRAVIVARGRKVPKGTVGVVRWIGEGRWGWRVGLAVEGEEKLVYTALKNVDLDESPEGLAREIDAAHDSAIWMENAGKAKAEFEAKLADVEIAKGDLVIPADGIYAGMKCKVFWVGATAKGIRVGVRPSLKGVRPRFYGGRPVWPEHEASWLPIEDVSLAEAA